MSSPPTRNSDSQGEEIDGQVRDRIHTQYDEIDGDNDDSSSNSSRSCGRRNYDTDQGDEMNDEGHSYDSREGDGDGDEEEEEEESEQVREREIIRTLLDKTKFTGAIVGHWYCLLDKRWWRAWTKYVGYDNRYAGPTEYPRPGAIDNSDLLESDGENVKRQKVEDTDYVFVPQDVWELLIKWYGGGPAVARLCISPGKGKRPIIEVRKLQVKVIRSRKPKKFETQHFSKATTIGEFIDEMLKTIKFDRENSRVYDFHNGTKIKLLNDMRMCFGEVPIVEGQYILIEERTKKGTWPNEKIYARYSYSHQNSFYNREPTEPGKTGLVNLGNTCFMASSLQCLSQTAPLVDFFLTGKFIQDINRNNPLGQKGELAEQYYDLLKELWSSRTSVSEPRPFKKAIEKCDARFAGYQQHDSQELLIFLLDGIHEDLNRVQVKPYVEKVEGDGKISDIELAQAAWTGHKARNDSVIVDHFQGLLKSTLTCPINGRISVTFDPFMYLTVPIPVKTTRKILVKLFWLLPGRTPTKFGVTVEKDGTIQDLTRELSKLCKIPQEQLVIVEVFSNRFHKHFWSRDEVSEIRDGDKIHAYEIFLTPPKKGTPIIKKLSQPNNSPSTAQIPNTKPPTGTELCNHTPDSEPIETLSSPPVGLTDRVGENNTPLGVAQEATPEEVPDLVQVAATETAPVVVQAEQVEGGEDTTEETAEDDDVEIYHLPVLHKRVDSYSQLFGIPFVISVPSNITYDQLYTRIIDSISFYLTKLPLVEDDSEYDSEQDVNAASSDDENKPKKEKSYRYDTIFEITPVNNMGSFDYMASPLRQDDGTLLLRDRQTLALNWNRDYFKEYYNKDKELLSDEHVSVSGREEGDASDISLYDCLKCFTTQEQLGPEDPWFCSDCKEFRQAFKKFDIWSAPPVLIIHLKRFSYRGRFSFREKLDELISFPLEGLDLSEFVIGPCDAPPIYDLYAVSNHFGSLGGGHYTAYAKHRDDGNWYCFDDDSVRQVTKELVHSEAAYVLFYRRRDILILPFDRSLDKVEPSEESDDSDSDSDSDSDDKKVKVLSDVATPSPPGTITTVAYGDDVTGQVHAAGIGGGLETQEHWEADWNSRSTPTRLTESPLPYGVVSTEVESQTNTTWENATTVIHPGWEGGGGTSSMTATMADYDDGDAGSDSNDNDSRGRYRMDHYDNIAL